MVFYVNINYSNKLLRRKGEQTNMGILSRFSEIMKANVNAALDKVEDPEKMIDQTLRELKENLAECKKETAGVMADEQRTIREKNRWQEEVNKWQDLAKKALAQNNEADAKDFLVKRNEAQARLDDATQLYTTAHANSEKMTQMYKKLENDITSLQNKRETLKAKVAVAKTQETINKANSKVSIDKTMNSFGELEERINKRLDAANAAAELDAQTSHDEIDEKAAKYAGTSSSSVDADLAALKAEMGL